MLSTQHIKFYKPHLALQPYVQAYAHLQMKDSEADVIKKLYPTDYTILSLDYNNKHFYEVGSGRYNFPMCFLGVTDFCRLFTNSPNSLIGIIFKPFGAYRILGIAQQELANKAINFADMFAKGKFIARQLTDDLFSPMQSIKIIEDWLLQQLQRQRYSEKHTARIVYAYNLIRQSKGTIPVNQLCLDLSLSETSLRNLFREYVGFSPKTFSQIIKFNLILGELHTNPAPDWQEFVYRFDFHDQTHFIKEFKRYANCTPQKWLCDNSINLTKQVKQGYFP